MPNPWFRLHSEFSTDAKVQMLPEYMQRRLVMIFCLRCEETLGTSHEREIAFRLRVTDAELAETKALFVANGFVDEKWNILNWNKRQFVSDSSTERTRRFRERARTSQERHTAATVTGPDTEQIQNRTEKTPPVAPQRGRNGFYREAKPRPQEPCQIVDTPPNPDLVDYFRKNKKGPFAAPFNGRVK